MVVEYRRKVIDAITASGERAERPRDPDSHGDARGSGEPRGTSRTLADRVARGSEQKP